MNDSEKYKLTFAMTIYQQSTTEKLLKYYALKINKIK